MRCILILLMFIPIISFSQYKHIGGLISGTSTITLVTPDTIWMGADSKEKLTKYNGEVDSLFNCKIRKVKNCAFMISGLSIVTGTKGDELANFYSIMSKSIEKFSGSIELIVNDFKQQSIANLEYLFRSSPSLFYRLYNSTDKSPNVLEISFSSFDSSNVIAKFFNISFNLKNDVILGFVSTEEYIPHSHTYYYATGYHYYISTTLNNGYLLTKGKFKDNIIHLIKLEAKENNADVGGDIDIISISKGGVNWLTNNTY